MKRYSIGQFAKKINKTQQTLRNWDKSGKLKPELVDEATGYRYYTEKQLKEFYGEITNKERIIIGYCRVSSVKQREALERQVEDVRTYLISKGYPFKIIMDISSGMNYDRKGLNQLMQMILQDEVSKVVVLDKDRLVRFGFELIENLCKFKSVDLEIIDRTEQTEEQEVIEDFIQIMTDFHYRLQGEKAQKMKAVMKEFIEND